MEETEQLEEILDSEPEEQLEDDIETEETDSNEEPEETEEDDSEEVDYEGKKYKLPKELKEALLRQSDYTKKTQEVAEQRKAIESQKANAEVAIQAVTQFQKEFAELSMVNSQIEKFNGLNWNEAINENPVDAMKLQMKYQELVQSRADLTGKINSIQQEVEQRRSSELQSAIQHANTVLSKEIPGWGADKYAEISKTATKMLGISQKELDETIDPRIWKGLHIISEFAKMQEKSLTKIKTTDKPDIKPTVVVKASGSSKTVTNPDKMSTEEWLKWRETELKKKGRR